MDKICIDELKIFGYHGVFEHENINGQNFYVNAVLFVDTENAGITDNLEYSVDYGSVCNLIKKVMTENTYKLIEAAAQAVAVSILKTYELVKSVDIEIRKPEAPIDMDFRSVSVKIHRSWHTALIALGSNMGDTRAYIEQAVKKLEENDYIKNIKQSELIITKPYGYTNQNDFLNGAVICHTLYLPHKLLEFMQSIENAAGRVRDIHWGPRTLDLDLILYDDEIINDSDLIVPHPDMHNRLFVLEPAAKLAPNYRHPVIGLTLKQLLDSLKNNND